MKTRAAVLVAPRSYEVWELPVPEEPPPGGALLRVVANGICGSDYDLYSGKLGEIDPTLSPYPFVPGHEMVGIIDRITPEAERNWDVKVGDRVVVESDRQCGECRECKDGRGFHCLNVFRYSNSALAVGAGLWGGMAEYMMLQDRSTVVKVPEDVSDEDASLFNPIGNSLHWTSTIGQVDLGERVLVLGAGQRGVGCCVIAREAGASQVIVTGLNRDAHKLAMMKEFGATDVINVDEHDTVEAVREVTGGHGVDLAVDTTPGATAPILHALDVLRPQGRLVFAGVKGRPIDGLSSDKIFMNELQIRGAAGVTPRGLRAAVQLIAEKNYPWAKLHTHRFGLEEVDRAVRILGGEIEGEEPVHITILPSEGS